MAMMVVNTRASPFVLIDPATGRAVQQVRKNFKYTIWPKYAKLGNILPRTMQQENNFALCISNDYIEDTNMQKKNAQQKFFYFSMIHRKRAPFNSWSKVDPLSTKNLTLQARPYWHWSNRAMQQEPQKNDSQVRFELLLCWTPRQSLYNCLSHWLCVGLVKEWLSENWGNVSNAKGNEWTRKSIIKAKIVEATDIQGWEWGGGDS